MQIIPFLQTLHPEMTQWRQTLHAHPQTAFEETFASEFIQTKLREWGIGVETGWAKTGVVGRIEGKLSPNPSTCSARTIALRADIDALDIDEQNDLPYRSRFAGKMHACGHDGHTAMLLGAARYLAATRQFAGQVVLIFQPAEENEGGGQVMVEGGLFERHPCDAVFGLHNWPGLPVGAFALCEGPCMAAYDVFELTLRGQGCHAAMPHVGADPIVAAGHVIAALQTIASRNVDPLEQVVLSLTQIRGGDTWNVIPGEVQLRGTVRTFQPAIQALVRQRMQDIVSGVAQGLGCTAEFVYHVRYPATVNTAAETRFAARVAADIVGPAQVTADASPCMGSEDFAYMLQKRPGCYIWAGNGPVQPGHNLHSAHYDFNDQLLPVGATYWSRLVETFCSATSTGEPPSKFEQ